MLLLFMSNIGDRVFHDVCTHQISNVVPTPNDKIDLNTFIRMTLALTSCRYCNITSIQMIVQKVTFHLC